jgi:BirA family biotin operon repressor/biotin-[acetyl-CoA-carboxylase] ligase
VPDSALIDSGVRLEAYDTLASTNETALARARAGERGPLWITASRQTAGRGRRGRAWMSEPGNLHATLLLTDPSPPHRAPELSFVAALALHDALLEVAPSLAARFRIKWPNDILVDGAKAAGILIEAESGSPMAVAVGIGVNCARHPAATAFPATDLAALGLSVAPQDLLRVLSRTMRHRLAQWDAGCGLAAIRADWLQRAEGIGRRLRVAVGAQEFEGAFETLDRDGRLILRLDDGSARTIAAGDVFPVPP